MTDITRKCPHCEAEIEYLDVVEKMFSSWRMTPDGDYDFVNYDSDGGEFVHWGCPECGDTIAETEEEAEAFWKGETISSKGDEAEKTESED